ncbi:MAG TPA: hypothetical protein VGF12_17810 [Roseateles sp.]|uniref:hypothetical protein n=1 Tax=Roseateles sp. TaxID=1971397 RepID=UPI002ED8CB43
MTTLIVLFNLKDAQQREAYEQWAREVDLPTAGALPSIEKFEVLRAAGVLGGGDSPYQYIEVLRVRDMQQLGADIATPTMQEVSRRFQSFADAPVFIVTEPV